MDLTRLHDQSFKTAEIARLLGISRTAVLKRADKGAWAGQTAGGRGGGKEWRYSSMDERSRNEVAVALCEEAGHSPQPAGGKTPVHEQALIDAAWDEFARKSTKAKEKAGHRCDLLQDVWKLHCAGMNITQAFKVVAEESGENIHNLINWYYGRDGKRGVKDIDNKDWLPFLVDNYRGRVTYAPCDETAWEWLKKDYLRKEQPSFALSYRRLSRLAEEFSWEIPSQKTLSRRMKREVGWAVIYYLRTGDLRGLYPDQERSRDHFTAGREVNGDALKFDSIYVDYGDGEISNQTSVWFMQDLHSSKILSWEVAKTENADMFRLAMYNLLKHTLPTDLWIDNTMAAANKALTGKARHRHRFKVSPFGPVGLLQHAGVTVHFTNPDQEMSNPGVKPIERAFQGKSGLHGLMRTWPSLKNRGHSKATAIPYDEFKEILEHVVAEFNGMKGRTGRGCEGRSYNEIYAESYEKSPARKPSKQLLRMLLCDQEVSTVSKGSVRINAGKGDAKHRYSLNFDTVEHGEKVAVVFNPKNLSEQVEIYNLDGERLGTADWMPVVAFNDKDEAREHSRLKRQRHKMIKQASKVATRMNDLEYKQFNISHAAAPNPTAQTSTTVLSQVEVEERLSHKVDPSKANAFRNNWQKRIDEMCEEEFPFAQEA